MTLSKTEDLVLSKLQKRKPLILEDFNSTSSSIFGSEVGAAQVIESVVDQWVDNELVILFYCEFCSKNLESKAMFFWFFSLP